MSLRSRIKRKGPGKELDGIIPVAAVQLMLKTVVTYRFPINIWRGVGWNLIVRLQSRLGKAKKELYSRLAQT